MERFFNLAAITAKRGYAVRGSVTIQGRVNVHGTIPVRWVTLAMLFLNLAVWVDAATQLAG
jgi:hypothetical protein